MSTLPLTTTPEDDTIVLQLRDERGNVTSEVSNFRTYSFNNHFLTPTDGFSFTIGDEAVLRSMLRRLTKSTGRPTIASSSSPASTNFQPHRASSANV